MAAPPIADVLLPALATGLATTVGAVPFLFSRTLSRRFYDSLLGFGAGLMLAAATLGLLQAALESTRVEGTVRPGRLLLVLAGFVAGAAILRLIDELIPHEHAGGHHVHVHDSDEGEGGAARGHAHTHAPGDPHCHLDARGTPADRTARGQGLLVVGVMMLHRLPEGLAIGAAYAAGGHALGLTLVGAVGVQNAVEGGIMAAPLRRGGLGASALLLLVTATGLVVPAAALAGYFLSSAVAGALPTMLALAAGALIYLTCNEVIPESHSHGHEVPATYGVLGGFLVIILLQALVGHVH